ncbi:MULTISPECIES: non-ribosomal peptide synthetase [Actinosynnema]|uniref:non-ribosomal peptide synthetase n=1 Tax=Actinosynnema TaxID=40566 RepID=UPI0020A6010A|nr:non-ribosomal peptide synthetase [Actinosynnema pretiosum]MCP2092535.1 amino acid adenylation domain-containing protein [Actinosynnema pretiosum]
MSAPLSGYDLFARWAEDDPSRPAVDDGREVVTYGALRRHADALATRIAASGVQPGDAVGLLIGGGYEFVVSVLGVWRAGAAYVPLPPAQPRARARIALTDTSAPLVIADHEPSPPVRGPKLLRVDRPGTAAEPADVPGPLAYVLYTSGSTGSPKGVAIGHEGVVNLALAVAEHFGDLDGARVLQFARPTFDAWVWELAMSLLSGGVLCLPPGGTVLAGVELARVLRKLRVTHLSAAPSLLASLPTGGLPHLRTLVSGGEPVTQALVERWAGRVRLVNAYGPTETTVCATIGACAPGERPTIGRPLRGVTVLLRREDGATAAPGEVGEVLIGGPGVGRGYVNRPEQTDESFLTDPHSDRPGALMYRTGDLARLLPSGDLEFIGRIDRQLNVRGHRVEPGEVEAALCRHPMITGAVVTADGRGGMVAHLETDWAVPVPELRAFLKETLPEHLVPSVFVPVHRLPLTAHGKVDHAALPAPDRSRPLLGHDYVAPRGQVERELAALWSVLLDVDLVGAVDDFAALGGTSVDLLRLRDEVAARWGVRLTAAELVEARTVRLLAARVTTPVPQQRTPPSGSGSGSGARRGRVPEREGNA